MSTQSSKQIVMIQKIDALIVMIQKTVDNTERGGDDDGDPNKNRKSGDDDSSSDDSSSDDDDDDDQDDGNKDKINLIKTWIEGCYSDDPLNSIKKIHAFCCYEELKYPQCEQYVNFIPQIIKLIRESTCKSKLLYSGYLRELNTVHILPMDIVDIIDQKCIIEHIAELQIYGILTLPHFIPLYRKEKYSELHNALISLIQSFPKFSAISNSLNIASSDLATFKLICCEMLYCIICKNSNQMQAVIDADLIPSLINILTSEKMDISEQALNILNQIAWHGIMEEKRLFPDGLKSGSHIGHNQIVNLGDELDRNQIGSSSYHIKTLDCILYSNCFTVDSFTFGSRAGGPGHGMGPGPLITMTSIYYHEDLFKKKKYSLNDGIQTKWMQMILQLWKDPKYNGYITSKGIRLRKLYCDLIPSIL